MERLMNIKHGFDLKVGDVGVTVRKGDKWSRYSAGTELELWNCARGHKESCEEAGCRREGTGRILGSWVGEFGNLPPNLLSIEHNNMARDANTLKEMMVAGDGSIGDRDIVTALIYGRTETIKIIT